MSIIICNECENQYDSYFIELTTHEGKDLCDDCYDKATDNVNSPSHYKSGGIETIDYIKAKLSHEEFKGFCKGNVIKYVSRETLKNGKEDLLKAQYYINELIKND